MFELNASEIHCSMLAINSRIEWIRDNPLDGDEKELESLISTYRKLKGCRFTCKIIERVEGKD